MAFRIYDEYELEQFMNKGLSPAPIVVSKGTGYSIVNYTFARGEFVNVLTAANQDYLSLDSIVTLADGEEFNFTFELPDHLIQRFLGSYDGVNNYISLQTNGSVFIQLTGGSGAIPIGYTIIGLNTLKMRRVVGNYFISANGGIEISIAATSFSMEQISNRASVIRDLVIHNFEANGETFSLNEPSGAVFTGSLGTTGLRNTSSLDPNYIDDVMIQPYTL